MKAIILAESYAEKESMDEINLVAKQISEIPEINEIIVVTNQNHVNRFDEWASNLKCTKQISILSDGSLLPEDSLGEVGEIYFAICNKEIKEDILVVSGECYKPSSLEDACKFFTEKNHDTVCIQTIQSKMPSRFIPVLDDDNILMSIERKQSIVPSDIIMSDICFFKAETLPMFDRYMYEGSNRYIYEGNTMNAIGSFIQWLCGEKDVYAYM
ncbi:MAG: hypothetical protein FWC89_11875 [Defluviitaleaceae bacterium]|nr:hypothetical protein [Defluviitaleaceae bacterium]